MPVIGGAGTSASVHSVAQALEWVIATDPQWSGGAKGDGTTDDTAALQAAMNGAFSAATPLYIPPGQYKISATLTATNILGPRIIGAGRRDTKIFGTTAMAGLPMLQFSDCRDHTVEHLQIAGTPSGTAAQCAINSHRSAASPTGGHTGTRLAVRHCRLGDDNYAGLARGVQWDAASTSADTNNDFGLIHDVEVSNFTVAAYDIGHANSLQHVISEGVVTGGPTVVRCAGGSYTIRGTRLGALTSFHFYFDTPFGSGTPTYLHRSQVATVMAESASPVIYAETTATGLAVSFVQYEHTQAPSGGATMIDFRAPGKIAFSDCLMDFGQPACIASFPSSTSRAKFSNCQGLGLTTYSYNGVLTMIGNAHIPGTVLTTNLGSGTLRQLWDDGGGFSTQGMSVTGGLVLAASLRMANIQGAVSITTANSSTSLSVTGNDHSGRIVLTTAAGLAADSRVANVLFGSNRQTQGRVLLCPVDGASAAALPFAALQSTSSWTLNLHNPPAGATTVTYDYFVVG